MEKLTKDSPETRSLDVVAENIAQLKALFPEATTEGRIDFEVLKQLLGESLDESKEKFGLNWHGKRRARQLALTPSTAALRPCQEESADWRITQNLMIEGDNLEVLKLLQKSYTGKVKIIYIDPPYNTGGDFIYPDNFQNSINNYLEITGQIEGCNRISSNTESSGRFHTDWLNMVYPRIRLAQTLLQRDGLLFISINDFEQPRLRMICDEIFGEENFVAQLIWMKGKEGGNDNDGFGLHHDYILCYAKDREIAARTIALDEKDKSRHITRLPEKNRVKTGTSIYNDGERFQLINLSKQKDYRVSIPLQSGEIIEWDSYCPQKTIDEYVNIGKLFIGERGVPYVKSFLSDEAPGSKPSTLITGEHGTTKAGGIAIRELFGDGKIFSYPKPPTLIQRLISIGCPPSDDSRAPIVMDFFAGSGTTGHAVMAQNAIDGGNRRFVLVQLPEPLSLDDKEQKTGAELCKNINKPLNIAELTKERLRRAGKRIKEQHPLFSGDVGFRVFKLDSSNIRPWDADIDNIPQTLIDAVEHIKEGRTEQDLLFELLLKLGLDLTVPMEQKTIAGKTVHSIGAGVLMVCLDEAIAKADYEALGNGIVAWHRELAPTGETTLVFRDSAFADDVVKTNLTAILSQGGLDNVRSL